MVVGRKEGFGARRFGIGSLHDENAIAAATAVAKTVRNWIERLTQSIYGHDDSSHDVGHRRRWFACRLP